ncbi:hypothetical protein CEXT_65681 [Caerostris extrusa]|uniref:Uncharacterized protein n=1 Tax=Caerostris extrusa TaxID=172846 RepID=A0AAV4R1W7_CAEEX|nr:hypothetical protein CEXT_65681 [Caerostris extrusa]
MSRKLRAPQLFRSPTLRKMKGTLFRERVVRGSPVLLGFRCLQTQSSHNTNLSSAGENPDFNPKMSPLLKLREGMCRIQR